MMRRTSLPFPSRGFSLVELMVAIVIGLLTVLVATDVIVKSAKQKRETVSGTDASVNATLGLYSLERDVKNAGFGINPLASSIGCEVRRRFGALPAETFSLIPIRIVNGAGNASDTIRVLYANDPNSALPLYITGRPTDTSFSVNYALGVNAGDVMVVVPSSPQRDAAGQWTRWCSLFVTTDVTPAATAGNTDIHHISGANGSQWNQNSIFPALNSGNEYWIGDYLLNLGSVVDNTYSADPVNGLQLAQVRYGMAPNHVQPPNTLYPNIVQLQAVYGRDAMGNDGVIDLWTNQEPANPADWNQVRAIRVALVARSANREAANVTPAGNTCAQAAANNTTPPASAVCWRPDPDQPLQDIDVSAVGADWRSYRYRVVETTIPLRNAIWAQ